MKAIININGENKITKILLVLLVTSLSFQVFANENFEITESKAENSDLSYNDQLVEDWMVDLNVWSEYNEEDPEANMELESWMMQQFTNTRDIKDENIVLEEWMLSSTHAFWDSYTNDEETIELENWMLDSSSW